MTLSNFLSIILMGIITGNVIGSTGVGVDLAGNNLNSIKSSAILSLAVFCVTLVSGLLAFALNAILISVGYAQYFIAGAFLIVASIVQVAEYVLEKVCPIEKKMLGAFIVTLIPTTAIILFSIFSVEVTFLGVILNILFECVGVLLVLVIIGGVRQNKLNYSSYNVVKGNLMTLVVLFVLSLIWTVV